MPSFLVAVEGGGGGVVGDVDVGPAVVVEVGDGDGEGVGADGLPHAGFFGDVGEGAVAVVVVEDVLAALEAGRAAGDLDAFVGAAGGFGERRGLDVEVDVVGDEEVEVAVAVVVEKGAAGVPAGGALGEAGFRGDVGEGAVAVVAVEDVLAVVGDEEVVPAVVVDIADAAALTPSGVGQAGREGDVGKGAVAVVLEQSVDGFLALGEAFEAGSVDEKNVEPVVVVEVVEGDAAAGGFKEEAVLVFAAVDGFGVEAGFARDVGEGDAEGGAEDGRRGFGGGLGFGVEGGAGADLAGGRRGLLGGEGEGEDVFEGEDEGGAGEGTEEAAAGVGSGGHLWRSIENGGKGGNAHPGRMATNRPGPEIRWNALAVKA